MEEHYLKVIRTPTSNWSSDQIYELDKFLEVIKELRPDIYTYQTWVSYVYRDGDVEDYEWDGSDSTVSFYVFCDVELSPESVRNICEENLQEVMPLESKGETDVTPEDDKRVYWSEKQSKWITAEEEGQDEHL